MTIRMPPDSSIRISIGPKVAVMGNQAGDLNRHDHRHHEGRSGTGKTRQFEDVIPSNPSRPQTGGR
jgi:hypothetical protein